MRRAGKFLALQPAEQRLLAYAFVVVAAVRLRLALLPFRPGVGSSRPRSAEGPFSPDQIAWAVDLASRYLGDATCLTRALAGQGILARHGFSSQVTIGVAAGERAGEGHGLIAHAWLEFQGRILLGGPDVGRYTRLFTWCS